MNFIYRFILRKYPEVVQKLENRHLNYNKCLNYINKLETEGKVFVFRPDKKVEISRLERDQDKLRNLYEQGYAETLRRMNYFKRWLNTIKKGRIEQ